MRGQSRKSRSIFSFASEIFIGCDEGSEVGVGGQRLGLIWWETSNKSTPHPEPQLRIFRLSIVRTRRQNPYESFQPDLTREMLSRYRFSFHPQEAAVRCKGWESLEVSHLSFPRASWEREEVEGPSAGCWDWEHGC